MDADGVLQQENCVIILIKWAATGRRVVSRLNF